MDNNEVITSVNCKDCSKEIVDPVVNHNFFFGSQVQDICPTCVFIRTYAKRHIVKKTI